jgi:hypothetical protein
MFFNSAFVINGLRWMIGWQNEPKDTLLSPERVVGQMLSI